MSVSGNVCSPNVISSELQGFDVVTGVALAGGAYVITFVVYVLKVERYHPIVRVTVLNGCPLRRFTVSAFLIRTSVRVPCGTRMVGPGKIPL